MNREISSRGEKEGIQDVDLISSGGGRFGFVRNKGDHKERGPSMLGGALTKSKNRDDDGSGYLKTKTE